MRFERGETVESPIRKKTTFRGFRDIIAIDQLVYNNEKIYSKMEKRSVSQFSEILEELYQNLSNETGDVVSKMTIIKFS